MATPIRISTIALMLLLTAASQAENLPGSTAIGDVVYKGVVGKALDFVPMDPDERLFLQRTNALLSSTFTARSIYVWVGASNPIVLIGGMVWGVFSATNIKATLPPLPTSSGRRSGFDDLHEPSSFRAGCHRGLLGLDGCEPDFLSHGADVPLEWRGADARNRHDSVLP